MTISDAWVDTPHLRVEVSHGTGKSVVTGTVRIAFNGGSTVYVTTEGHVNDDGPHLVYRGRRWLASAHLRRGDDGSWSLSDGRTYIREQTMADTTAPPSFAEAMTAALVATVVEHWTDEHGRAGAYARAVQSLGLARADAAKAEQAAREAARLVAELEAEAARNAPG